MKNRYLTWLSLGVGAAALLGVTLVPVEAQLAGNKGGKQKIRLKSGGGPVGKIGTLEVNQPVDFGGPGVWGVPYITDMAAWITDHDAVPFTPLGKAKFDARRETDSALDPEGFCLPPGVPRMMYTPYPMKIIQTPGMVTMIFEGGAHIWRQIPIAEKGYLKHPPLEDLNPTYLGHSIGWYEDDTLVIDSIGFNDRTWLDFAGHPHGEKLHVIERFRRIDTLNLEHTATIEDPEYYTEPWTVKINVPYRPGDDLLEYICQENERDSHHQEELLKQKGYDLDKAR